MIGESERWVYDLVEARPLELTKRLGDLETWGPGDSKIGSTCGKDAGEKGSSHLREGTGRLGDLGMGEDRGQQSEVRRQHPVEKLKN